MLTNLANLLMAETIIDKVARFETVWGKGEDTTPYITVRGKRDRWMLMRAV